MPVLALGACADAHLRTPDVRLPTAFQAPSSEAAATLAAADLDRWWTLFGDPQLTSLVEEALASAPTAHRAMARLEEAESTRSSRLTQFLPKGDLKASATQQHTDTSGGIGIGVGSGAGGVSGFNVAGDTQTYSTSFNPSWELDVFGRSRAGRRGVYADFAATRFNIEASRMSLAAQVGQSLFQTRALAVQLADAVETARLRTDTARVGRIRAERGLGTTADSARFNADLASAEAEIARLTGALTASKRTLLVLLGRGADPVESLVIEPKAEPPPAVPGSTPGELLARRPDVREAEARLRLEIETVAVARLALFPTFTLNGGGSISKSFGANSMATNLWSIGLGASLPILDRPRLLAELKAEKARGEQTVIAYEVAVQTAYGEAENALVTLKADQTRMTQLEAAETASRFAYDAARKGYQAGLTDVTTLLDAERSWRLARSTLLAARSQALLDAVTAFKALGGGWSPSPPIKAAAADKTS